MTNLSELYEIFGKRELAPSLFYDFEYGLRFELEDTSFYKNNISRFIHAFERAKIIINDILFQNNNNIIILISNFGLSRREERNKKFIKTLTQVELPLSTLKYIGKVEQNNKTHIKEFGEDLFQHWYCLDLHKKYTDTILWLSLTKYMPISPKLTHENIYIVDFNRKIICHIYDYRGMDVIAIQSDELLPFYSKFDNWLFNYDREKMDANFSSVPFSRPII